jgi:hypothetical protein
MREPVRVVLRVEVRVGVGDRGRIHMSGD